MKWAMPSAFLVGWILVQAMVPNAAGQTNSDFLSGSLLAGSFGGSGP